MIDQTDANKEGFFLYHDAWVYRYSPPIMDASDWMREDMARQEFEMKQSSLWSEFVEFHRLQEAEKTLLTYKGKWPPPRCRLPGEPV